jgi:membrane-bound lytic murein transglycosylase A
VASAVVSLLVLLLASCATPRGLVEVERPGGISWVDDGSALMLSRAIDHSIAYYQRLPPGERFRYGALTYSPAELIASAELFRSEFLSAPDGEAFAARIAERFHVFESRREEGDNLFTGYYEPELTASGIPTGKLRTPLYALPSDMVRVRLERFGEGLPDRTLVGRVEAGELLPYFSRREIQAEHVLAEKARPIAYVDEVDLFFLQIQGSGQLRFPDGRVVKVGYAASNGHPYRSIGALLVRDNRLALEEVSLQRLRAYLAEHPEEARRVLFHNPSYVFFQEREDGPFGHIRVPLTPGRSLATDRTLFVPGGLAYLDSAVPLPGDPADLRPLRRFMLVQDTGGAIRGSGRGDVFWGAGAEAEWTAGHMKSAGRLFVLVARKAFLPAGVRTP